MEAKFKITLILFFWGFLCGLLIATLTLGDNCLTTIKIISSVVRRYQNVSTIRHQGMLTTKDFQNLSSTVVDHVKVSTATDYQNQNSKTKYPNLSTTDYENVSTPTDNQNHSTTTSHEQITTNVKQEKIVCKTPTINPWDPTITQYIKLPTDGIPCTKIQPYLSYLDDQGNLLLNETEVNLLKLAGKPPFNCTYRTFDREYGYDDEAIWYSPEKNLTHFVPVKFDKDSVEVVCRYKNQTKFYHNLHAYPAVREDVFFGKPTEDQLSVLFLMIDSVSHSALKRNFPLTYNYTKNVMGMKYFNGFHKIGTNSFPNQMAMLTGRRMYAEQSDMPREVFDGFYYNTHKMDSWPFIWKYYQAKSYATVYNCDWASMDIFTYQAIGFKKKVFDYNYHWFWYQTERVKSSDSSWYCFYNEPFPKISLDIIKGHFKSFQDTLQFIYTDVTETTHSENEVARLDRYYLEFWKEVFEGNYLNKTFIIFASDHGPRLGGIRGTYVGAMEDRLPYYSLWFPPWFYKKYPHIKENIEENLNMVSSSFDVYETLKDMAMANYDGTQRPADSRGLSQLYRIPKSRTCKSAGIADRWCTCLKQTPVNTTNNVDAKEASTFLINYMNDLLKKYADLCHEMKFTKFNFFHKVELYNEEANDRLLNRTNYFIGLETSPNEAAFEVFMTVTLHTDSNQNVTSGWTMKSDLDRTSRYKGYYECISDPWLQYFCSCKNASKAT